MIILLKAILMMMLPFYRIGFNSPTYPKSIMYLKYSNGDIVFRKKMEYSDPAYIRLRKFIRKEEEGGWQYDIVTYAPHNLFLSKYLNINCVGEWIQISKKLIHKCPIPSDR